MAQTVVNPPRAAAAVPRGYGPLLAENPGFAQVDVQVDQTARDDASRAIYRSVAGADRYVVGDAFYDPSAHGYVGHDRSASAHYRSAFENYPFHIVTQKERLKQSPYN